MELVFRILAVILIGIAAYFLWQGNGDSGFVSAVFSAVALLLSIRFEVKKRVRERAAMEEEARRLEEEEQQSEIADH
ncbi:MAG TPA: hypothetical protein VGC76_20335 [Pyrinomonadaceae bacterium]|jgi:hypothetical protein